MGPKMKTSDEGARAEALFHAITEAATNARVGVIVTRSGPEPGQIDIVYLNTALASLLETSSDEIRRAGVWSFMVTEELDHIHEIRGRHARGMEIPNTFQTVMRTAKGTRVPIEVALGNVELDGQPANVAFIVDITARVEAEQGRRASQMLFDRVVKNAPDGIFILRWPKILFANPAGAHILGISEPANAVGVDLSQRMSPEDSNTAESRIHAKLAGARLDGPRQYRGKNPDGRNYALEISSIPIEFESAPAVLSFARDVTERNALLKKLGEAEAHEAMSTLAAGVAHEINNPLAYLLLNLEFLARELRELDGPEPGRTEGMQRRLDDARQGAERVKAIVRDLQALTRKDQNIRGPVELEQAIENALALARHETRQRVQIETHFEDALCVSGNSTRLEQLFFNLIANAAHAMGERELSQNLVRITFRRDGPQHVLVEVSDNGCGMEDEVRLRAFEPFFSTKPLGVGSGLGLPICKRIVEDLGGQITVQSRLGYGTTASVRLRIHDEPPEAPPAEAKRRRGHVLVVDDERAVADSLRFALKDDHEVDTATTSKDARAALDSGTDYDVVLCDLVMPVESGMELHAYVRERYPILAQRFVFMTGGAFTPRAEKFLRETQNPRIEKPFELEALRDLIDSMVAARG